MSSFFRSRMFTIAFRFFAVMSLLALVAAFASALMTDDQSLVNRVLGPLSLGWKGGVGNHLFYVMFVALAVLSGFLALLLTALRDADPEAQMQLMQADALPESRAAAGSNLLPLLAVVAVGVVIYGQFAIRWVTPVGLALLAVVIVAWTLQAARADRAPEAG